MKRKTNTENAGSSWMGSGYAYAESSRGYERERTPEQWLKEYDSTLKAVIAEHDSQFGLLSDSYEATLKQELKTPGQHDIEQTVDKDRATILVSAESTTGGITCYV